MPRLRVIVLERPEPALYNVAFWADVPAARQAFYATPGKVSAWKDALSGDNTNLQNGSVVESVRQVRVPGGWTITQIESEVETQWTAYQASITNSNPWVRYGSTWDGATWVLTGAS